MSIFNIILICLAFGGLMYFWQQAPLHNLDWTVVIFASVISPLGIVTGLYWAYKDLRVYFKKK
jgi:hypothetical protein